MMMQRKQQAAAITPVLSLSPSSPSFSSYSSSSANLAEIAARVVQEFRHTNNQSHDHDFNFDSDNKIFDWNNNNNNNNIKQEEANEEEEEEEEEEFEFAVVCNSNNEKQEFEEYNTADEIFFNGQIRPFYPLFDRDLLLFQDRRDSDHRDGENKADEKKKTKRLPLGKLMREESEAASSVSCSSSEAADDLDNLQPGTYCVWTPQASKESSPAERPCRKSNSTGTHSKRWNRFRDLLYRSHSDGKDTFLSLNDHHQKKKQSTPAPAPAPAPADAKRLYQEHYMRNRSTKDQEDKRRSYLPYRQDLLGFFHNVHGFTAANSKD